MEGLPKKLDEIKTSLEKDIETTSLSYNNNNSNSKH